MLSIAHAAHPPSRSGVDVLPSLWRNLSDIQQHVLARVATHSWTHDGSIPYVPPNAHQAAAALSLAAPDVRFLAPISQRPAYRLTQRGTLVVCRLFRIVNWLWDIRQEQEFDRMREFVKGLWEDDRDD